MPVRGMPPMTTRRSAPPRPPIGWPLLPTPDAEGRLRYPDLAESLRQQIRVILETAPGALLMQPAFGSGLTGMLHEPNTPQTRQRMRELIVEALVRFETRIALAAVTVEPTADGREINVEIAYRVLFDQSDGVVGVTLTPGGA